jgi:hypothetical protein
MSAHGHDYAKWSERELRRAESVAARFLEENGEPIGDNFHAKVDELAALAKHVRGQRLSLDERLHAFARIAEIARALEDDARGFFHMASEPVVARILAQVESKPR